MEFRPNPFAAGARLREWYSDTSPEVELGEFRRAVWDGPAESSRYYPQVGTADWALASDPSREHHRAALVAWMRANGLEGEPAQTRERVLHYRPGAHAPLHADDQRGPDDHFQNQAATLLYVTGQGAGGFTGGSLAVPRQGKVFAHRAGQMLVTPSFTPYEHEILPVTGGRRIVIVRHWTIFPP